MQQICVWKQDEDGFFITSCNEAFEFIDGGIKDNHFKFCPYCGHEIRESKLQVEENGVFTFKVDKND